MSLPRPSQCKPLVVIISGPSGVGKDVLLSRMRASMPGVHFTVTATTRPRRPNEKEGVDYYFISRQEFESMEKNGEFLEWANVYGNLYGVPRQQVSQALSNGEDVVIKTDIQGARTLKKKVPGSIAIFIAPPDMKDLASRLTTRNTDSQVDINIRLKTAIKELEEMARFDYVVTNYDGKVDESLKSIQSIIQTEKCRLDRTTYGKSRLK